MGWVSGVTSIVLVTNSRQSQFSTLTIEAEYVCGIGNLAYISSSVHRSGHSRVLTDALCSIVLVTGVRYARDLSQCRIMFSAVAEV